MRLDFSYNNTGNNFNPNTPSSYLNAKMENCNSNESHTENRGQETSKHVGSSTKAVMEQPHHILNMVRPKIYNDKTIKQWPFTYDRESSELRLVKTTPEAMLEQLPTTLFSKGPCVEELETDSPFVVSKLQEFSKSEKIDSTQGKLFMGYVISENVEVPIVIKADQIHDDTSDLWLNSSHPKHLDGDYGIHTVIDEAYMDGMCSILLSNLVEKNQTPHFPLCYATGVSKIKRRRTELQQNSNTEQRKRQRNDKYQSIWMEYLPTSMYQVITGQSNPLVWWSLLFQVSAGLISARHAYNYINNDLHGGNLRVRRVPYHTRLYYKDDEGRLYSIPTFGYVFVMIDFGRSFVWFDELGFISSAFYGRGKAKNKTPDNPNVDLVRFIISIEDLITCVTDQEHRKALHSVFKYICRTDEGKPDILQELLFAKGEREDFLIDELPRIACHNAEPYRLLNVFHQIFGVTSIPEDIVPFELHKQNKFTL